MAGIVGMKHGHAPRFDDNGYWKCKCGELLKITVLIGPNFTTYSFPKNQTEARYAMIEHRSTLPVNPDKKAGKDYKGFIRDRRDKVKELITERKTTKEIATLTGWSESTIVSDRRYLIMHGEIERECV